VFFHHFLVSDAATPLTLLHNIVKAHKSATADKQNVPRVNLQILLLRMFASALRRHACNGSFQNLEQGLLNAFTGDIACNRDIFRLSRNLIDFVNIDNPALCARNVAIRRLDQIEQNVFNVFADVAGLCQRGRISNGKGDIQHFCKRFCEKRLAASGRPDQQNITLFNFDIRKL